MNDYMKSDLIPLKYLDLSILKGKTPVYSEIPTDYVVIGQRNNSKTGFTFENIKYTNKEFYLSREKYEFLQYGDILVNSLGGGTCGRVGIFSINDSDKIITDGIPYIVRSNTYDKYLYYVLLAKQDYLELISVGATNQVSLKENDLKNLKVYYNNNDNIRNKIVLFLDEKNKKINELIYNQELQIENLKTYRQTLIIEVITKGLNQNVTMIKPDIDYVLPHPSHWKILRGKNILSLLERPVLESDEVITCFRDGEVTLRSNRREDGFTFADKEIGYQGIETGDLVIHGMDGFAGAIGISTNRGKGSPVLSVCDSNDNKRFIMYYLRSLAYRDVILALSTGIRVRSCDLRWNKVANLMFPMPKLDEQAEIVAHLDKVNDYIDNLILIKKQKINKLNKYKKSLIYEYVTGKKRVE